MPITNAQWDQIEKKLGSLYNRVTLRCDGYKVSLGLRQISTYKNAITVYVDGNLKGAWLLSKNDSEERRRFFPLYKKSIRTQKEQRRAIRIFGKNEASDRGYFKQFEHTQPYWSSFRSLKRHFIANNKSIELIDDE